MPTTTKESLSPTRVRLSITVTPDELKPSLDHAYQHIAEQIQIPGFRKGKVPPPIIDQRVGRGEVLNHAVSEGLDRFFQLAVAEEKVRTLGRPEADVTQWPSDKDFSGDLVVTVEVDVRPDFELPKFEKYTLEVEPIMVTQGDVDDELDALRSRFGNLVTVDRPAKTGDFVQIDLIAKIGDSTIDSASSISYEMGSGQLIDGIDEALDTLTAGETTTFESKLLGGDREGEMALIEVTVLSVKERELPEADDDFAQIASQFDTIKELREDLKKQAQRKGMFGQAQEAREKLVEKMLAEVTMPLPQGVVDAEVNRHLEQEGRLEDDKHRAEVVESTGKSLRTQLLLDALVEKLEVQVSQDELTQYLMQSASQYQMEPTEFIQSLDQNGQIPSMVGEVARSKSLSVALAQVTVKDTKGKKVDLSEFTSTATDPVEDAVAQAVADNHEGHDH
ncbi:MAG: trigger factor [Actinomycetota bacterium]|nr:trigger factor [Actinomycetota bacterium]MDA2980536.1 trigger factor [Actinomycetota bacterium]MDA3002723.1 trigger factor [Actinomycetota bacterium]